METPLEFDIEPANAECRSSMRERLDRLAKPPGSLGRLEELAVRLAGMQHRGEPRIERGTVVIFAATHEVAVNHDVSAYPPETTGRVVEAICDGSAAVGVFAERADLSVETVALGVSGLAAGDDRFRDARPARTSHSVPGAADITREAAASGDAARSGFRAGVDAVDRGHRRADLICLGDVGIGNTTSAAAVAARLLGVAPASVTGPGTGLDDEGIERKRRVVRRALDRAEPGPDQPLEVLAELGGPDFLAMAGCCLRAAEAQVPVVVDGFIVSTAALGASLVDEAVADYLLPATLSPEPGHRRILEALAIGEPLLDWSLRLGEASAASLVVPLLRSACAIPREMATLEELMDD